jgi:hypothetical protein
MITYSNQIHTVIDKVASIISTEMVGIPLGFDEHRGNSSLLIIPNDDTIIDTLSNGQIREYGLIVSYELAITGQYSENNFKQISNVCEHIKKLFAPENNATVTDFYFDAIVQSIAYEREENLNRGVLTLTLKRLEV